MNRTASRLASTLVAVFAGLVAAAKADIQLPAETVKLRPSTLTGFEIASQKCAICHSADYIAYQPPGMNQAQWTAEVAKMHTTYGAPIDVADIKRVGIYLTAAYGDASSIAAADLLPDAPARALEGAAGPTPVQGAAPPTDVQAILSKNACLGCHALQQKIVGPAYRDVAAKYRSDPQALSKVAASIREGGVGRWGSVPMPPFHGLSESELKALAEFVLGQ